MTSPQLSHFFYRLSMIAFIILAIFIPSPYGLGMQFWYFTLQTNVFVAIIEIIICTCFILNICGKKTPFLRSKAFLFIKVMITFFITITGVIYCFVLAPSGIITGQKTFAELFEFREVILHIIIPTMTIVDCFIFTRKNPISPKLAWLFLLYPLLYFFMINMRVLLGGNAFYDGSKYPYFFVDPTINNQGWGMVAIYIGVIILLFYGLARLYIFLNNKLISKNKKIVE